MPSSILDRSAAKSLSSELLYKGAVDSSVSTLSSAFLLRKRSRQGSGSGVGGRIVILGTWKTGLLGAARRTGVGEGGEDERAGDVDRLRTLECGLVTLATTAFFVFVLTASSTLLCLFSAAADADTGLA